jgi:diguanylate cyclase (GGDEF)-like protein/PAS domain S-box-containing protein
VVTRHDVLPSGPGELSRFDDTEAARHRDLIFDQAPLGMALVDTTGLLLRVNAASGAIVGRSPDDLVGRPLSDMVHPADRDAVGAGMQSLVSGAIDHLRADARLVRDDGRVVWVGVHASCVRDTDETALYVIAQIEDITERRAADVALAEAEERFRTIFDMAPIGMILTDATGVLLRVNPAFCDIVGRDASFLVGSTIRDLTHPDDLENNLAQVEALASGDIGSFSIEKRYVHADGHAVWTSVSASCVRDTSGKPIYLIGQVEDITESRARRERLVHAAIHDPLTALPNRDLFVDRLDMALRRAKRAGHRVAVMFLDLDRFKTVNDSLGHAVGDRLLRAVADRMSSALRVSDTLARFGGDEFTVLCDEVVDETHALEIAERMLSTIGAPLTVAGSGETRVSFSAGIALSTTGEESGATLLRRADIAMYRAKKVGPARIEIYAENDDRLGGSRLRTARDLERALERDEFELHYQPIVDLRTRSMVGMEALVRWRHPSLGLLSPDEFIFLAEDSSLMIPLGAWALEETCRQAAVWNAGRGRAGLAEDRLNISVNVAAPQLLDPGFPDQVAAILNATGENPERLWLHFTESTVMRDAESTVRVLHTLRALGVHFGIDEFGTGYSSLAYLKRFPVEALKIDPSFVREVDRQSEDAAVVKAIIGLGDALGMLVLAGGVERWDQASRLQTLGCHLAEGHLLGMPLHPRDVGAYPTDDLAAWHRLPDPSGA